MDSNQATQTSDCHSQRQGTPGTGGDIGIEQVHFRPSPPHLDTLKTKEILNKCSKDTMDTNQATPRSDCHSQRQGTPCTEGDMGIDRLISDLSPHT